VILQLLEIPDEKAQKALKGVMMELEDCAFPLLAGMSAHGDPMTAFKDIDYALLVGARPRGPGMEREGPAGRQRPDLHRAGQGAECRRQPQREGARGRQPGQHQCLHRDEERARSCRARTSPPCCASTTTARLATRHEDRHARSAPSRR
jgi:hypothetical protein